MVLNPSADPSPETDSGLICLALAAQHHGKTVNPAEARRRLGGGGDKLQATDLARIAGMYDFKAETRRLSWEELTDLTGCFPLLARCVDGDFVVLAGIGRHADGPAVGVFDPQDPQPGVKEQSQASFAARWSGEILFLKPVRRLTDPNRPFGLGWFVPELLRRRTALRDVALAAVMLHVLALASPIYFQIVIDKVLPHQSINTLTVLTLGVAAALCFEAAFRFVRQHIMLEIANRIDIRLLNRAFGHLLRLPIAYFDSRPAGVTVRHLQQAERIREFLTGQLLSTLLDSLALFVALPLLSVYSGRLTLMVLGFAALSALLIFTVAPVYRRRLNALYAAEAERQAMLVETTQGIRTVKSSALEPQWAQAWDVRAARTVQLHYSVGRVSLIARSLIELLEKLMMAAVVAAGAFLVFAHELSIGALIAFQMLAGRVSSPLAQMVGLINQYQETLLSVRMLGEIMNHPAEPRRESGAAPPLDGGVVLDKVGFRYQPDRPPALRDLSLNIPPGMVLGVVGRSGSGKSTLVRLLQGFYPVGEGRILFGDMNRQLTDQREIDVGHLRRSVGVVLQDNFLFRGTVRDNIAMTLPNAPMDRIIAAARLAGADSFIADLPQGYDTPIEEGASNLSGGQRQRIAIARALLPQPRLLIFDEATSALDPESESVVMENLARIARGRTVILVSHRLSTLVDCHAIAVLEQGRLQDVAPHAALLQRCETYARLWRRQNRGG
jgi:ATP-binding cassette, subfamily B, bacterial HlyB/CyaB